MKIRVPMRCPVCLTPMQQAGSREEKHVDPSGHGVYVCCNDDCPGAGSEPMVYRRVIKGVDERREMVLRAANQTRDRQLEAFHALNDRMNELTRWLRDNHPEYMDGKFKDSVAIAIHLLSQQKGATGGQ